MLNPLHKQLPTKIIVFYLLPTYYLRDPFREDVPISTASQPKSCRTSNPNSNLNLNLNPNTLTTTILGGCFHSRFRLLYIYHHTIDIFRYYYPLSRCDCRSTTLPKGTSPPNRFSVTFNNFSFRCPFSIPFSSLLPSYYPLSTLCGPYHAAIARIPPY